MDEPAFRRLLEIAEPRFKLPHWNASLTVIPAKYCATRAVIENQLAAVENCAVTTDLWISLHQQHTYILQTAHFANSDFNHESNQFAIPPNYYHDIIVIKSYKSTNIMIQISCMVATLVCTVQTWKWWIWS